MSNSDFECPHCQKTWAIRLVPGEICPDCQADLKWEQAQRRLSGQFKHELQQELQHQRVLQQRQAERESLRQPPQRIGPVQNVSATTRSRWSMPSRRMLRAWFLLLLGVGYCVVSGYFFGKYHFDNDLADPWDLLKRLNNYLTLAIIMDGISFVLNLVGLLRFRRPTDPQERTFQTLFGVALLISVLLMLLALGNFFFALDRTPTSPGFPNEDDMHTENFYMHTATTSLIGSRSGEPFHKLELWAGTVIHDADGTWIVTQSPQQVSVSGSDRIYVQFADGSTEVYSRQDFVDIVPGISLVSVQVPLSPHDIERGAALDALAAATIIGDEVTLAHNPINATWGVSKGTVIWRKRHLIGDRAFVQLHTTVPSHANDQGAGVYNSDGQFIGIVVGYDAANRITIVHTLPTTLLDS